MKFYSLDRLLYILDGDIVRFVDIDNFNFHFHTYHIDEYPSDYWRDSKGHDIREIEIEELVLLCPIDLTNLVMEWIDKKK